MSVSINTEANIKADASVPTTALSLGRFISFEGTEGVGKTTAIDTLCTHLQASGIDYIRTREPGGSPFAEQLRAILLDPATDITDDTELLLMFAARCDHMQQLIMPALERGTWVICDRFIDSTVAYQGFGRAHGDPEMLAKIDALIAQFIPQLPDLTLWLDLPVDEGMARAGKRSAADRFEQQASEFFTRVYEGFDVMAAKYTDRICRIDASGSVNDVSTRIWKVVQDRFNVS